MKTSIKSQKIAKTIQRDVSAFLNLHKTQNGFDKLTITEVQLTTDLAMAIIYYTINPDDQINRDQMERVLHSNLGRIRSEVAKNLNLRRCPTIEFKYDDLISKARHIEDILSEQKKH